MKSMKSLLAANIPIGDQEKQSVYVSCFSPSLLAIEAFHFILNPQPNFMFFIDLVSL